MKAVCEVSFMPDARTSFGRHDFTLSMEEYPAFSKCMQDLRERARRVGEACNAMLLLLLWFPFSRNMLAALSDIN
jgi:hypothetical protein